MPTNIPVTAEDFAEIGRRYAADDLLAETNRLTPLATTDIAFLATHGYGKPDLDQLGTFRDQLVAAAADQKQQQGTKKGSRKVESDGVKDGKLVLRSGIVMARNALIKRTPAPNETVDATKKIAVETAAQIDALVGRIGKDSSVLETRLKALLTLLALPALVPPAAEAQARADFVTKAKAALAALPTLTKTKKGDQQDAKAGTTSRHEIEGRAYTNLKMLTDAGRAYWNDQKNPARAAEYQLNKLHPRKNAAKPASAAKPANAPSPGATTTPAPAAALNGSG